MYLHSSCRSPAFFPVVENSVPARLFVLPSLSGKRGSTTLLNKLLRKRVSLSTKGIDWANSWTKTQETRGTEMERVEGNCETCRAEERALRRVERGERCQWSGVWWRILVFLFPRSFNPCSFASRGFKVFVFMSPCDVLLFHCPVTSVWVSCSFLWGGLTSCWSRR